VVFEESFRYRCPLFAGKFRSNRPYYRPNPMLLDVKLHFVRDCEKRIECVSRDRYVIKVIYCGLRWQGFDSLKWQVFYFRTVSDIHAAFYLVGTGAPSRLNAKRPGRGTEY
jgi:hypothetical protein